MFRFSPEREILIDPPRYRVLSSVGGIIFAKPYQEARVLGSHLCLVVGLLIFLTLAFVNSHIANMSEEERNKRWKSWINNFKKGCRYECDFFALGSSGKYPAYEIASDGIYRIRSYRRGYPYLVCNESFSVATQEDEPNREGMVRDLAHFGNNQSSAC